MPQATWVNGLGEECVSRVYSSFIEFNNDGQKLWLVVYNWRTCGFIVINGDEAILSERG
jgi:hypothetical protein